MTPTEARAAIEEILASIPDHQLPDFDRVEFDLDGKPVIWRGGRGWCLGSATSAGKRDPLLYRRDAARHAIEEEMVCRADMRLFANDDDPSGVEFPARRRGEVA